MSGCNLGMGCDEAGVCYATAHGEPARCGSPSVTREFADTLDGTKWRRLLAFRDVSAERNRQDQIHGGPPNDDQNYYGSWRRFIDHQLGRLDTSRSVAEERQRFVKVAALAVAAIESIDRTSA